MKLFYKRLISIALATILSLFSLFGCMENQMENLKQSTSEKSNLLSYCAKEKTEGNRIYYNYPQFRETVANAEKLNDIIIAFVESALQEVCVESFNGNLKDSPETWKWDNTSYTLQAMDINYKILRNDLNYLSVTFEGIYNHKASAHPINYFNSLTIDRKQCKPVTLFDLYRIDTDFV